jgi:hypothetical protein
VRGLCVKSTVLKCTVAWMAACSLFALACGGPTPPPDAPVSTDDPPRASRDDGNEPTIEGTVGALDAQAVKGVVSSLNSAVRECVQKGQRKLPFLDGEVGIRVTVDANGRAVDTFVDISSLGDHEVERCIVKLFASKQWPRPVGGKRGEIAQSYAFDAGHMEPPDVWSADTLESKMGADDPSAFGELIAKLDDCRKQADTGPVVVTMYLDEDGLVRTAGLSMSDAKGTSATDCVVTTLQTTTFPSPGDNFVKATVAVR